MHLHALAHSHAHVQGTHTDKYNIPLSNDVFKVKILMKPGLTETIIYNTAFTSVYLLSTKISLTYSLNKETQTV